MSEHILFFVFAVVCEIIGTLGGFGSSVIFVPVAGFFFPRPLVLSLTSILHIFSNISKIALFWKHINLRLLLLYGIPSLLFTIGGALLADQADDRAANTLLGIFLVLFSLFFLLFPSIILPDNKTNAITSGSIAGFAAGFLGTGGAIRGVSLAAFNLQKDIFVGTSAAIDFGVDLSRFIIYTEQGFMANADWIYVLSLFAASWIGTWLGKKLLNKLSQDTFKKTVLTLILLTGIVLLIRVATGYSAV
ncbi:MAG: sulfite exporter TauE/SafE family protein [Crocinitomicaceae bacterium]|nr:sulfite exporter TauE/SafE family protein [Crocinitomicaceae bacterium]